MKPVTTGGEPLKLILCWHMHQPDYRHQGEYLRPWTWLHAIKDYTDMATHLEAIPGARAVVNFSPVLIEQLQDYPVRIQAMLQRGEPVRDAILDALGGQFPSGNQGEEAMTSLLRSLLRVNEARMKNRFPAYARLHERAVQALAAGQILPRQQMDDLLTWYVLVWLGESLRKASVPAALQVKESGFTLEERRALLAWLGEVLGQVLPRYRALADSGRVELSVTPFAHPILPLLLDLNCAREAWPDVVLPAAVYPGGAARCDWHLAQALRVFRRAFGRRPAGCWPAEGGISAATLRLLARHGFAWTASGTRVLCNSLGDADGLPQLYAWRQDGSATDTEAPDDSLICFFRDDGLSDRIGFEYSKLPANAALDDFIQRLEQVHAEFAPVGGAVLSIIMDGENAWEYFPHNAWDFLHGLYARLAAHPDIHLTTFAAALQGITPRLLPGLVAGSWVHGTFSTWIGDPAKNRAWELLIGAKRTVDAALEPELQAAAQEGRSPAHWVHAIWRQLAVCEASDWFWWLGEDNRLEDGPAFDELFRQQLADLYELIGMAPPAELSHSINGGPENVGAPPFAAASGQAAGAMRPAGEEPAD
ncbi:MAG TPA: glycoside hydrolase family 57 protein [Xanthomonadales bacterium]|nr:glycoside hydrolase family 57 protein [Xanthomonadales bacterium]